MKKTVIINDPLLPSKVLTTTADDSEIIDIVSIEGHDPLCPCLKCNETFGTEKERLHNMEMEIKNTIARERVNSYGPTVQRVW